MSAIVPYQPTGATLPDKVHFAQELANADLLPGNYRRKPGNVLLAVEYGEMLNVHPLTAIQQVHVIEGKLTMSAELMRAKVHSAGHKFRVIEHSPERATVQIVRADDPDYPTTVTFTMDNARRAKLTGKDNWAKHPAAMLLARATSAAVRAVCPEVLMGISYVPEEMGAEVDVDGHVLTVAEVGAIHDPPDTPVKAGWAKNQVLRVLGGDIEAAAAAWAQLFPDDPDELTLGDVRDALDVLTKADDGGGEPVPAAEPDGSVPDATDPAVLDVQEGAA